jgi:cation diffusion facilitator CzcD-associated flavoprotein CzcO
MTTHHVDVVIIGAGVSGIGAACHLTRDCPGKSYVVLERRDAIGGTWDLFRYPGIRSDSDMLTFGYNFRPWTDTKVLADGPAIRGYLEDTAAEYGVTEHIRFGRNAYRGNWSTEAQRWTIDVTNTRTGEVETYIAKFVISAGGYYSYEAGFTPDFPGQERFGGEIVHPQHWPADLDYRGKRVVVIGSGATAITLVPAMAGDAAHVTMLQRSPTYVVSLPSDDVISEALRRVLPDKLVYRLARGRNILIQRGSYALARKRPDLVRAFILGAARRQLGPDFDMRHFSPRYDPWDQRLCVVPNGDLFRALRKGTASVVTDEIETFTETGLRLQSGDEIEADIIVTATGLRLEIAQSTELTVDGATVGLHDLVTYKGVMVEGVPNAAVVFGYTNASWTLKADIACEYVCRLINHMDTKGYGQVVAIATDDDRSDVSVMSTLNSSYVHRADTVLPRQGTRAPWRVLNNYIVDVPMLRYGRIDDGHLHFTPRTAVRRRTDSEKLPA